MTETEVIEKRTQLEKWEDRNQAPVSNVPRGDYLGLLINRGADLETLEKFMALQERHEANEARKAYHKAMAAFKKNPPAIVKDAHVAYKQTSYSHATLGNVAAVVGAALSEHGLSAGWKTEQNGHIAVTCTITHELGHSESTTLSADADTSGSKNAIQAIGSTITYLQRYTLMALTGIAAQGQDDDGNMAGGKVEPVISDEQKSRIVDMVDELGDDISALLKWQNVAAVEQIPAKNYKNIMDELNRTLNKRGGK